jgi:hypothetical protein
MAKQFKIHMDTFALGSNKGTVHVLVSIIDEQGVAQRAWCGAPLFEEASESSNIKSSAFQVWDLKVTAFQAKALNKKICKRCADGNYKLICELQEEIDNRKLDS